MSVFPYSSFCEQGPAAFQEDAVFSEASLGLLAVFDGLGTKGSGAKASTIAWECLVNGVRQARSHFSGEEIEWKKENKARFYQALEQALQDASHKIYETGKADASLSGMCTSLDFFLQLGERAVLGHVGAGRIYLSRAGEVHQLTEDHTQYAHYLRLGKLETIPKEQHVGLAKKLTRAVGFQDQVKVDLLDLELQSEDEILLCTDGVWQTMSAVELQSLWRPNSRELSLANLRNKVQKVNGKDNFTAAILLPSLPRKSMAENSAEAKIKMTAKISLFHFLSYQELIKVIGVAEIFKVAPGTVLCKEGEPGAEMMVILSGSADVQKAGKRIASLKQGEMFGEMSMLDAAPRSATIVSAEATNLLAFPRESLFALLREEPVVGVKFLWGLSQELNKRLRATSNKLVGKEEEIGQKKTKDVLPFLFSKEIQ